MNPHALATRSTRFMLRQRLNARWLLLIATAVVLTPVAVVAYAFAGGSDKLATEHAGGSGTQIVRVELVGISLGFDITPDVVMVDPRTHLVLEVVNEGKEIHDFALDGGVRRIRMLKRGESQ